MSYGNGNSFWRWVGVLALASISLTAEARKTSAADDLFWNTNGNTATGTPGGTGYTGSRSYAPTTGGATMSKSKPLPWPGKSQAQNMASWKMKATPTNMAKSMMRPGMALPIMAGGAFAYLLGQACVRLAGGAMELSDGGVWEQCKFTQTQGWEYATRTWASSDTTASGWQPSFVAALEVTKASIVAAGSTNVTYTFNASTLQYEFMRNCGGYQCSVWGTLIAVKRAATFTEQTGWEPTTEADAETKVAAKLTEACDAGNPKCADTFRDLIEGGTQVEAEETPTVTGPASVQGSPTVKKETVQSPSTGQPVEKTTTTTTTYNYTYNTNVVTQTSSNTTTITTYADSTPSETETETETDERSHCEKNPEAFECQELDVPDTEVPKSTKNVTFSAEDLGWGAGACPAPFTWTDRLGNHSLNLASYCDMISNIVKPVLLAMAALMAMGIAIPAIRVE